MKHLVVNGDLEGFRRYWWKTVCNFLSKIEFPIDWDE